MKTLAELVQETLELPPEREAIEYQGEFYDWGDVQRVAGETRAALAMCEVGGGENVGRGDGERARGAVSFVPRNRPSALSALAGMLADGRTVRMIYAFQSPTAIATAIARLDSPVVVLGEADLTAEVRAVLGEKRMACITLGQMSASLHPDFATSAARPVPEHPPRAPQC